MVEEETPLCSLEKDINKVEALTKSHADKVLNGVTNTLPNNPAKALDKEEANGADKEKM